MKTSILIAAVLAAASFTNISHAAQGDYGGYGNQSAPAMAVCWTNRSGSKYYCDGPLQKLLSPEARLSRALEMSGCSNYDQVSHSGKYTVYNCNKRLKSHDRDISRKYGL